MPENYAPSASRSASAETSPPALRTENLALLYQGVFTGIVRVQAGRQPIGAPDAFQRRMEDLLVEIDREATKAGYRKEDIEEANYAVVAFLDETVLTSQDPARDRWSSWQAKKYTGAIAGEGFFEHLKVLRNRRESLQLADVLEVYYLCLLLGYQGRYAIDYASELQFLIDDLRLQIERVRGRRELLSPDGAIPPGEPVRPPTADPLMRNLQLVALLSVSVVVLSWGVLKLLLVLKADAVRDVLLMAP